MYVHIYIYIYVCISLSLSIYIYTHLVRHGNREDVFCLGFPSSTSSNVFVWFPSLVVLWFPSSQEIFVFGFRRCLFMDSVVAGKHICMVSVAGFWLDSAAAGGSNILECIERFLVCCVFRTGFRRCFLFMVSVVAGKHFLYGFRRWFVYDFRRGKEHICLLDGFRRWFVLWFPAATGSRLSLRWKP